MTKISKKAFLENAEKLVRNELRQIPWLSDDLRPYVVVDKIAVEEQKTKIVAVFKLSLFMRNLYTVTYDYEEEEYTLKGYTDDGKDAKYDCDGKCIDGFFKNKEEKFL